ncbi:MAG: hypothetical protein ACP5N2_05550 [Candidatus Nanoarchaeia archaeon]
MTEARLELDDYTTRVLDVIKGKHGLKNRNEALKKLVEEHGSAYVEREPNQMALEELDKIYEAHKKKYGLKKMTNKELKKLLGL